MYNAIVRFLSKVEGGRMSPPMSGYMPHMKVGEAQTSCRITTKDPNIRVMDFGIDYEVLIEFLFEEQYLDRIKPGMNIGIYEGHKLVGHGYLQT
jgi:translation elongation factor EF-Tu-like GTPase